MSSEDSDRSEASIGAVLEDIKENAKSVKTGDEVASLKERIDALELMYEEFGQARELQIALHDYVRDLKEELADLRNFRLWITTFSFVMSLGLYFLLFNCMVMHPQWFVALDGHLQVSLIAAIGGGAVLLMSLLLRGVYRSRHERNHGEMLPEAVKIGLEALRPQGGA
ncbi:MAG: hypothetical protein P8X50_03755 [Maritimibacter sp.]